MEDSPSIETVYEAIYALYNQNTNPAEKQQASNWLNEMQKSVCDQSAGYCSKTKNKNYNFSYFAHHIRYTHGRLLTNC